MNILQSIHASIVNVSSSDFFKTTGIAGLLLVASFSGGFYYYFSTIHSLKTKVQKLNKQRSDVKQILETFEKTNKNKKEIDALLAEEKEFKIKNFFDTITKQVNLDTAQNSNAETTEEIVLPKQYSELKLIGSFKNITTQQLCNLLSALEQKKRIYTKDLTIIKTKNATLDVTLTIATLKPLNEGEIVKR